MLVTKICLLFYFVWGSVELLPRSLVSVRITLLETQSEEQLIIYIVWMFKVSLMGRDRLKGIIYDITTLD